MEPEVPDGEDIDPEVLKKQMEDADPFEERLKTIAADKNVKGDYPAWNVRLCGETSNFVNANPVLGHQNYGVVVAKSNQWPGSMSFFTEGRWL